MSYHLNYQDKLHEKAKNIKLQLIVIQGVPLFVSLYKYKSGTVTNSPLILAYR
ncbi:hypothetical protein ABIB62_000199 [Mucilaginibacter sp. UYP25]